MEKFVKDGLIFDYDEEADTLYISDPSLNVNPQGEMTDDGIIVRRNPKTDEICGITILDFLKRTKKGHGIPTHLSAHWQAA